MTDLPVHPDKITTDPLNLPWLRGKKLQAWVLRLDKMHPEISGNKWFKLKYYLAEAANTHKKMLISFGGPYSNHIVALACAAHNHGFASAGVIRGERPAVLSPSLSTAMRYGMTLEFLPRLIYQDKDKAEFLDPLHAKFPDALIIPEGGAGDAGTRGAEEILSCTDKTVFTHLCCAVGTGTTLAGLINASAPRQQITGISVLKGTRGLEPLDTARIREQEKLSRVRIIHDYHFGGYARKTDVLLDFMNALYSASGIPTDFVYTGKLFYAIADLARNNYFPDNSRILIIHSGGLQGNISLPPGRLQF
jgi:1-aminocyclopropane-1-carboxylate deaminase